MIYYIDTSILVAYYCPEYLSKKAEQFILSLNEPIISVLTEIEFLSALSKKLRKKEINKTTANKIIKYYQIHVDEGYYKKVPIKLDHYLQAKTWLSNFKIPLSTLDALHLSIAVLDKIPFVTADKKLATAASKIQTHVELLQ